MTIFRLLLWTDGLKARGIVAILLDPSTCAVSACPRTGRASRLFLSCTLEFRIFNLTILNFNLWINVHNTINDLLGVITLQFAIPIQKALWFVSSIIIQNCNWVTQGNPERYAITLISSNRFALVIEGASAIPCPNVLQNPHSHTIAVATATGFLCGGAPGIKQMLSSNYQFFIFGRLLHPRSSIDRRP